MMLGHLYYKERNVGRDAKRDYFKARLFYEKSFTLKSIYKLGEIYENGYGVKKNYTKAREYYELAAKKNFHRACLKLGDFYKNGLGVQINMKKSIDYYFISFEQRDKNAAFNLGNFYENGIGVKQDYRRAIYFYNKAAHFKNFNAFLKLANIYLNGKGVEIDVDKAIHYLLRLLENDRFIHFSRKYRIEGSFYVGNNDLGLIYITEKQNIEAAHKYIKEAAYSEYSFGRNNFGLFNQMFLNKKDIAKEWFERSSKDRFAIASYNLGYLYEKESNIEESIKYYIKASEDEDVPLMFHNRQINDERLEISKIFILCLNNLKLTHYYLSQENDANAKIYFIKSISKLIINYNHFYCILKTFPNEDDKYMYSFLHDVIFKYNDFNFPNHNDDNDNNKKENKKEKKKNVNEHLNQKIIDKMTQEKIFEKNKFAINSFEEEEDIEIKIEVKDEFKKMYFVDASTFFDLVCSNLNFKKDFIQEILSIIGEMDQILYSNPYHILFGRIDNRKPKKILHKFIKKDINRLFYKGFGIKI
ncbi:hypothetical protein M9Y10_026961 [Tritrichomonas musculus]|uniref:Uncharacterized protein n=1 Tax=Tritrichomonas musculus TaxID=1915356 RepID=A0ABR2H6I2_9EUKA